MLFKTKKEMLALKGEERKQLPVAGGGFLEGGALSGPMTRPRPGLAGASLGALALWLPQSRFRMTARLPLHHLPRSLSQMDVRFSKPPSIPVTKWMCHQS